MHAVRGIAGAQTDHRYRQGLGQVLRNLGSHDFSHDRETAGIHERPRVIDQFLGAVGGLALRRKAAELRNTHRTYPDMALHRDARLHDGFDELGVVLIAFAFHDFGAGLRDVLGGVVDRLLRRQVKTHVRHVHHAQPVLRTALDGLRHEQHFLK